MKSKEKKVKVEDETIENEEVKVEVKEKTQEEIDAAA